MSVGVGTVRSVGHRPAAVDEIFTRSYRRGDFQSEIDDLFEGKKQWIFKRQEPHCVPPINFFESTVK
jgi:hypothetical protein